MIRNQQVSATSQAKTEITAITNLEASLKQSLTGLPVRREEYVAGQGFIEREYQFKGDEKTLLKAWDILAKMNRPFEGKRDDFLLGEKLAYLRSGTKSRNEDQMGMNVSADFYMNELSKYPVYVALMVLDEWPNKPDGKWWPAIGELKPLLEEQKAKCARMLHDIEQKLSNINAPKISSNPIYSAVDQEAKDDDERRKTGLLMKLHRLGFFKDHENAAIKEFTSEFISKPFDICERVVKMYQQQIEVTL